jgi:hypothetical protein
MMSKHAILTIVAFAALVLVAGPAYAGVVPDGDFCDTCHAAGNCCNPNKVLCVSCAQLSPGVAGLFDGEDLTQPGGLEPIFGTAEEPGGGDFCDTCIAAGNCCNPNKVLCVSCALQSPSAHPDEVFDQFSFMSSCNPLSVASLR